MIKIDSSRQAHFMLRFQPLSATGTSLVFPCDGLGHVDMDALEEQALRRYLYARAVIGHEFAAPVIEESLLQRVARAVRLRVRTALQRDDATASIRVTAFTVGRPRAMRTAVSPRCSVRHRLRLSPTNTR